MVGDRLGMLPPDRARVISRRLSQAAGANWIGTLVRYGAVVFGVTPPEQEDLLRKSHREGEFTPRDEEIATIELSAAADDHIPPRGRFAIKAMAPDRILVGE